MKINHADVAKKLGISTGYWSQIRHGHRKPSIKLALKIEKFFPDKPEYKIGKLIPEVGRILKNAIK